MPLGFIICAAAAFAQHGAGEPVGGLRVNPPGPTRLNTYFSNDDYPAEAVALRAEGTVAFRVVIGVDGRVTECRITSSSSWRVLDETTCRIARERFRFRPALDRAGRPIASLSQELRVTWRMPAPVPPAAE